MALPARDAKNRTVGSIGAKDALSVSICTPAARRNRGPQVRPARETIAQRHRPLATHSGCQNPPMVRGLRQSADLELDAATGTVLAAGTATPGAMSTTPGPSFKTRRHARGRCGDHWRKRAHRFGGGDPLRRVRPRCCGDRQRHAARLFRRRGINRLESGPCATQARKGLYAPRCRHTRPGCCHGPVPASPRRHRPGHSHGGAAVPRLGRT